MGGVWLSCGNRLIGDRVSEGVQRSRTHAWTDPNHLAAATRDLSGADYYAAWQKGELVPPMAATLGFELADFGEGHIEITCVPTEFHYSPYGVLHGGLAATLLDSATGCAVHTRLPAGTGYATVNLNLSFVKPITIDTGPVRCIGDVSSMGRRMAVADAQLNDIEGRLLAQATSTCLIIQPT